MQSDEQILIDSGSQRECPQQHEYHQGVLANELCYLDWAHRDRTRRPSGWLRNSAATCRT